jgi:predicted DNA-binding protein (MmcQ/YjbR family)
MHLDELRKICLSFPHASEGIKWENDLCFMIGEKLFCVVSLFSPIQVSLKVTDEEFDEFTGMTGIIPAPYVGKHKWILIQQTALFNRAKWKSLLEQSYSLVKAKLPKKIQEKLR